ncbi:hypothetical protein FB564_2900 [Salinispora arenicola]|uniref:Uncharacterized protein n=1 Tax=Salinispora arenicola TaxID=168697 RepID=A0A542XPE6_SALAC|nr:hypothetical protein FB564_2900 [Salinispora arenicola]
MWADRVLWRGVRQRLVHRCQQGGSDDGTVIRIVFVAVAGA